VGVGVVVAVVAVVMAAAVVPAIIMMSVKKAKNTTCFSRSFKTHNIPLQSQNNIPLLAAVISIEGNEPLLSADVLSISIF
jgi:hypothetical protein